MPISTYSTYLEEINDPEEIVPFNLTTATSVAGRTYDLWVPQALAGAAPATNAVPTRATAGSLGQQNGSVGTLGITQTTIGSIAAGAYILCDRLSHTSGLDGTQTGARTVNLPTPALTRYTDGVGVMCMLTIYTQVGATGSTITVSYTNQAGTSGRTSPSVVFGGTGFREANRGIFIPCASGDSGFRAVASVNLVGSTGTTGAYGVTLFKPLLTFIVDEQHNVTHANLMNGKMMGGMPEIVDDAALFFIGISQTTTLQSCGTIATVEW